MTYMKDGTNGRKRALPELIRKEIGSDTNRRFLARLPAFRPSLALPDDLQALLGEIDRVEARSQGAGK